MLGGSYGLVALGAILVILGFVNHYTIRLNPVVHTSSIVVGAGGVLALVGLIMYFIANRSANSAPAK